MSEATSIPTTPMQFKRVQIIVNPAAGQTGLNLPEMNRILSAMDVDWEMSITRKGGEAHAYADQALAAGVDAIAVFGGDGTILEVASRMVGSDTPLLILPGGTANVLSVELGVPQDPLQAALLLGQAPNQLRALDMGMLVGAEAGVPVDVEDLGRERADLLFFHLGIGLEGALHEQADREAKDRMGMMAYIMAGLKTLSNPNPARYRLTLDGQTIETEGINCMITNFGSVGMFGLTLSHAINVSDGLLDVLVFQSANIPALLAATAGAVTTGEVGQPLLQWQAREVTIEVDPPQSVVVDGELIAVDSITARIVPQAVHVIVPA